MRTAVSEFLYWTPVYVLGLLFLVALLAAVETGYRIGMRLKARRGAVAAPELSTIQTAMLGLLGLLLAFTYSFVAGRVDARKQAVIEEANALGTAYLRTQFRSGPVGDRLRELLHDYAQTRVIADAAVTNEKELQAAIVGSERAMAELWPTAVKLADDRPSTPLDALLFQSINEVIDMHTRRLAASRDRLPGIILAMLVVIAVMSLGITGFSGGLAGRRSPFFTVTLAVMIAAVTLVIIDLDRPRSGLVRVSQQSLMDALEAMNDAGAAAHVQGFNPERKVPHDHE